MSVAVAEKQRPKDHSESTTTRRVMLRERNMAIAVVALLLATAGILGLLGNQTHTLGWINGRNLDLIGLAALFLVLISTIYVYHVVQGVRSAFVVVIAGICCAFVAQLLEVATGLDTLIPISFFAPGNLLRDLIIRSLVIVGVFLLLLGLYLALLESERIRRSLQHQGERLKRALEEKTAAEIALTKARTYLQEIVTARTEELAERNEQLQNELAERRRFEEALALRLRYEEGLAACSKILLSDSDAETAMPKALQHLLRASQCARVYLMEIVYHAEYGPSFRLTDEVWDEQKCPECQRTPNLLIPVHPHLVRWLHCVYEGLPISGTVNSFPSPEREQLEKYGIASLLILPVCWQGEPRGVLVFDEVSRQRHWTPEEIRFLRTAAEMVGACRSRQYAEAALRRSFDQLEQRVMERTAALTEMNQRLHREIQERIHAEEETSRLEMQLRQAQKMQALGTLAGGIAHDFNNILASIIGYTELALRKMEPGSPFEHYFREVLKSGNRAKELVKQILLFSRGFDHPKVPVDVACIAREVVSALEVTLPSNVTISATISDDAGTVMGDAVYVHQVLLNLCSNAIYAMKEKGGLLEVSVRPVTLEAPLRTPNGTLTEGDYVRVVVRDNGEGIPSAILNRIFDPFFTTKPVGEGNGMGLALVHGVVGAMDGVVNVQSEVGVGTQFEIYIPRCDTASIPEVHKPLEHLSGHERLLIVDDEPQLVALWEEMLRHYGYTVTITSSSMEALKLFQRDPQAFDIVLLDQQMPHLCGADLAKRLLTIRPDLPIVMITGFSETVTPELARELGVREFLYKPVHTPELVAAIRRALQRTTDEERATMNSNSGNGRSWETLAPLS